MSSANVAWSREPSCGILRRLEMDKHVLPIYDMIDGHAKMYFANHEIRWDREINSHEPIAGTQPMSSNYIGLILKFSWPDRVKSRLTSPVRIAVRAYFQPRDSDTIEEQPFTRDSEFELPHKDDGDISCSLTILPARKYLPWGVRGKLVWAICVPALGNEIVKIDETPIEVYWIHTAHIPEFLFRGVPVGVLRKFLLPLRLMNHDPDIGKFVDDGLCRRIGDGERDWLTYVVEKLHFQKSMKYDTTNGEAHYFNGRESPLHLDHWIDDCAEREVHLINCYDLAALIQAILPLGLRHGERKLQMKIMQPFGYIKQTNLIGWGKCNSPLSPTLVYDQNDIRRTAFERHVFMVLEEANQDFVLDATSRPLSGGPHNGRESLKDYYANSVDTTTILYNVPDRYYEDIGRKPKNSTHRMGTLLPAPYLNPYNWVGVNQLYTQPEIFHPEIPINSQRPEDNVLSNVLSAFSGWNKTHPNMAKFPDHLYAKWTFTRGVETMVLEIRRCALKAAANEQFAQAKARLKDPGLRIDLVDSFKDFPEQIRDVLNHENVDRQHCAISRDSRGIALWVQGTFFVMLSKTYADGLAGYMSKLYGLMDNALWKDLPKLELEVDESEWEENHYIKHCRLDDIFTIRITNVPEQKLVPINVYIEKAKVLYLSSSRDGSTAEFKFLARARTNGNDFDVIKFHTFNAGMVYSKGETPVRVSIS